jgi:hypothetical protein
MVIVLSIDQQRPTDPLTAADAASLLNEIKKATEAQLQPLAVHLANLQRAQLHILDVLKTLSTDLAETRVRRLQEELFEIEREREILENRLRIVDAKGEMKKSDAVGAQDTNEKMKKAALNTYLEQERTEQENRAVVWRKRWDAIVTAVLVTTSVGLLSAVIGFLWWLVQLYANR